MAGDRATTRRCFETGPLLLSHCPNDIRTGSVYSYVVNVNAVVVVGVRCETVVVVCGSSSSTSSYFRKRRFKTLPILLIQLLSSRAGIGLNLSYALVLPGVTASSLAPLTQTRVNYTLSNEDTHTQQSIDNKTYVIQNQCDMGRAGGDHRGAIATNTGHDRDNKNNRA